MTNRPARGTWWRFVAMLRCGGTHSWMRSLVLMRRYQRQLTDALLGSVWGGGADAASTVHTRRSHHSPQCPSVDVMYRSKFTPLPGKAEPERRLFNPSPA